jgi:hypothetical protein
MSIPRIVVIVTILSTATPQLYLEWQLVSFKPTIKDVTARWNLSQWLTQLVHESAFTPMPQIHENQSAADACASIASEKLGRQYLLP